MWDAKMLRWYVQMWKSEDGTCRCEDGKMICLDVRMRLSYIKSFPHRKAFTITLLRTKAFTHEQFHTHKRIYTYLFLTQILSVLRLRPEVLFWSSVLTKYRLRKPYRKTIRDVEVKNQKRSTWGSLGWASSHHWNILKEIAGTQSSSDAASSTSG